MTSQATGDGAEHAAGVAAFMEEADRLMASLETLRLPEPAAAEDRQG